MYITNIIGIVGASIILIFFVLNQLGKVKDAHFSYDFANTIGAGLLVVYAYSLGSIPFVVLNCVWMLVSLRDVLRHVYAYKSKMLKQR